MTCVARSCLFALCVSVCIAHLHPELEPEPEAPYTTSLEPEAPSPAPRTCSNEGDDCSQSMCCAQANQKCYKKNVFFATCLPVDTCVPGVNLNDPPQWRSPWSCEVLSANSDDCVTEHRNAINNGDIHLFCNRCTSEVGASPLRSRCQLCYDTCAAMTTALPAPVTPAPATCSNQGDDCSQSVCCAQANQKCYKKNDFFATCLPADTCVPGVNLNDPPQWRTPWSCEVLSATPAPTLAMTSTMPLTNSADVSRCVVAALPQCGCDLAGEQWCTREQHCYDVYDPHWMTPCGDTRRLATEHVVGAIFV